MEQWQNHFHFKKDVLSDSDYSFDIIGQEEVLNELLYRVQAGDLVFLEGAKGSGKTHLLFEIIKKYRGKRQVVYLDCKDLTKGVDIEDLLLSKFGWFGKLIKKLPMNMILLLDNIQKLDYKNSEAIKYFFDQGNIQSVIFTSENRVRVKFSGSLWQRIGRRVIQVRPLKHNDAIKLLKDRIGSHKINNNGIKMLFDKSKGNIRNFLTETGNVMQYMFDNDLRSISEDELEEVIYGKRNQQQQKETTEETTEKTAEALPESKQEIEAEGV